MTAQEPALPPASVPEGRSFRIGPCLGRGGFGEVYLARMSRPGGFELEVALKVLHAEVDPAGQAAARLADEARLLALVRHRAVPRLIDLVRLEGRLALVSEYVEGADLRAMLEGPTPPGPRALAEALADVADALHAAWTTPLPGRPGHTARIVHRDLKPANLRLGRDGGARLLDFGIATTTAVTREAATQTAAIVGSPAYMAPERYDGAEAAPAADVFSLGAVLAEALGAPRLLGGLDVPALVGLALHRERFEAHVAARLSALPGELPATLRGLVASLTAWDPAARPSAPDTAEALAALAPTLAGPSLRAWARGASWPAVGESPGPWSGRTVTEGTDPDPAPRAPAVPWQAGDAPAVTVDLHEPRATWAAGAPTQLVHAAHAAHAAITAPEKPGPSPDDLTLGPPGLQRAAAPVAPVPSRARDVGPASPAPGRAPRPRARAGMALAAVVALGLALATTTRPAALAPAAALDEAAGHGTAEEPAHDVLAGPAAPQASSAEAAPAHAPAASPPAHARLGAPVPASLPPSAPSDAVATSIPAPAREISPQDLSPAPSRAKPDAAPAPNPTSATASLPGAPEAPADASAVREPVDRPTPAAGGAPSPAPAALATVTVESASYAYRPHLLIRGALVPLPAEVPVGTWPVYADFLGLGTLEAMGELPIGAGGATLKCRRGMGCNARPPE